MNGYHADLFGAARTTDDFRRVLFTTKHTQLVVMMIPPGGEIGSEVHDGIDQVLIAVDGSGTLVLDGEESPFLAGNVVVVPEGMRHNFINTGHAPLRIATIYGPPDHAPGTVHHTKADAERDEHDKPPI
jgi:mannose-6-phosphate isomerase-like protein (cupin superfamily)